MKRGSKRKTYKRKTYKRKTYKRKTYKRKTYKRKTYKRKTYKKSNVKEINKKRKSKKRKSKKRKLIGGSKTDECENWERQNFASVEACRRFINGGGIMGGQAEAEAAWTYSTPVIRENHVQAVEKPKEEAEEAVEAQPLAAEAVADKDHNSEWITRRISGKVVDFYKVEVKGKSFRVRYSEVKGAHDTLLASPLYKAASKSENLKEWMNRLYLKLPDAKNFVATMGWLSYEHRKNRAKGIQDWFKKLILFCESEPPEGMSKEDWIKMFMEPLDNINFYNLDMKLIDGNPLRH